MTVYAKVEQLCSCTDKGKLHPLKDCGMCAGEGKVITILEDVVFITTSDSDPRY